MLTARDPALALTAVSAAVSKGTFAFAIAAFCAAAALRSSAVISRARNYEDEKSTRRCSSSTKNRPGAGCGVNPAAGRHEETADARRRSTAFPSRRLDAECILVLPHRL